MPAMGEQIKRQRERLRWTQQRLADELGVNRKTVDNWENGRTYPQNSIGALEEVLGVKLHEDDEPNGEVAEQQRTLPGLLRDAAEDQELTADERELAKALAVIALQAARSGSAPPDTGETAPVSDNGGDKRNTA